LVKEADTLAKAGYDVTVIYTYWNAWATAFDEELLPRKKWKAIRVGGDPQRHRSTFLLSKLIYRAAKMLNNITGGYLLANVAIARPAIFLTHEAKKHKADFYLAHNLGALPGAIAASGKYNKPCGFDAEDFHRNEGSDNNLDPEVILKSKLEDRYLPQLDYFTTSSPLIAEAYSKLYPGLSPVVLLNVFAQPATTIVNRAPASGPLKLFWFSQTIGPDRGLEDVIDALNLLPQNEYELHLLGSLTRNSQSFADNLLTNKSVKIYAPIAPDDIITFAGQFDVGLALEKTSPFNRDICLTNKIFTYMQAGLAVVATATTAQKNLLAKNEKIGSSYTAGNAPELAAQIANYHENRSLLSAARNESLRLAREKLNWEAESLTFLKNVEQTLQR
jgi:glycosyltransferase involved in cell wall biosynthesis